MIDPQTFIQTKQTCWAQRTGVKIGNQSKGVGLKKNYVTELDSNFFTPFSDSSRAAFEAAQGNELASKMLALASSAALAVNLFAYWDEIKDVPSLARLLEAPHPEAASSVKFESIHPIFEGSLTSPNLDAEIVNSEDGKRVFVECKFVEPYRDATTPIKQKYLDADVFDDLPNCRLAAEQTLADQRPKRFNASQALTHLLGIKKSCGVSGFRLLYLWYNIPGPVGVQHAEEAARFARTVGKDGVDFQILTVQEFLIEAATLRSSHAPYVDYVTDRYL